MCSKVHAFIFSALQDSYISAAPCIVDVGKILVAGVLIHVGKQGIAWVADSAVDHYHKVCVVGGLKSAADAHSNLHEELKILPLDVIFLKVGVRDQHSARNGWLIWAHSIFSKAACVTIKYNPDFVHLCYQQHACHKEQGLEGGL